MALLVDHFWRDVVRSSTHRTFNFIRVRELSAEAEVADLDDHVLEKDVVDDEVAVHELDAVDDLTQVVARLDLCQLLSPSDKTSECLTTRIRGNGRK